MDSVALHEVVVAADALEEEGDEGEVVPGGQGGIDGFEFADEGGSVIGREGHAGEDDAGAGGLEGLDHLGEVGLGDGEGETAEAIVAAEFEEDDGGVFGEGHGDAGEAVLGGIAADAEVEDAVGEFAAVEILLEEVGEALAGVEAEAGGDAIAEAEDGGAGVGGRGCGYASSGRGGLRGGRLGLSARTQKEGGGERCDNEDLIQVRALTKSIDTGTHRVEILRGIDLEIPRGQFAAIMGPSGSGKSTLLGLLAGLDTPTTGQVILDGEEITHLSEDEMALLRGRKIGFVFQSYHLIPALTAEENVLLPMELAGAEAGGRERARELLERVGLQGRFEHYPVQLSGGEQQRVALARAFALKPPILLADEPTGNLDSATGRAVLELLLSMNREQGTTMVMVTHEETLAASADRRIVLRDGLVVSQ